MADSEVPADRSTPTHVYVANQYPSISETFVANEMLVLRDRGVPVFIYSLLPGVATSSPDVPRLLKGKSHRGMSLWVVASSPRWIRQLSVQDLRRRGRARRTLRTALNHAHAARLARAVRRRLEPDGVILHAHFLGAPTDVVASTRHYGLARATRVATVHASDAFNRDSDDALTALHGLVAASNFVKDEVTRRTARTPLTLAHCGVHPDQLPAHDPAPTPTVVTVARLIASKGYQTMQAAMLQLAEVVPELTWEIVGDGPLRPELEAFQQECSETLKVVIHGSQPHAAALRIMSKAWVALLLARQVDYAAGEVGDGIPVALMEAAAMGVAVVSTAAGGIPELVEDGRSGRIIADTDPGEASQALAALLHDPDARAVMGARAKQTAAREFDVRIETSKMLAFVTSIYESGAAR